MSLFPHRTTASKPYRKGWRLRSGKKHRCEQKLTSQNAAVDSTRAKEIKGMAKMLESMSAEDAARILQNLKLDEAKKVLMAVKKKQAGKILSAMEPRLAARMIR